MTESHDVNVLERQQAELFKNFASNASHSYKEQFLVLDSPQELLSEEVVHLQLLSDSNICF